MPLRHTVAVAFSFLFFVPSNQAFAKCVPGETRISSVGAVFTCETENDVMGESWRDPDGTVWGDILSEPNGDLFDRLEAEAFDYCLNLNPESERAAIKAAVLARQPPDHGYFLPRVDDFNRLGQLLGYRSDLSLPALGYKPQVLPHLKDYAYWSSTLSAPNEIYYFDGRHGDTGPTVQQPHWLCYRCVRR